MVRGDATWITGINDRRDPYSGRQKTRRGSVEAFVIAEQHQTPPCDHTVASQILLGRAKQHHSRAVVLLKDDAVLDCARRDDYDSCTDAIDTVIVG